MSFKFNGIVSELQAKLDSGERLLQSVKPVKDVTRREDFGTGEDRRVGRDSLLMEKLDRILDRRSPELRRRTSEDPDRILEAGEGSESRRRYRPGIHVTSGHGSLASSERRAQSVTLETTRGRTNSR